VLKLLMGQGLPIQVVPIAVRARAVPAASAPAPDTMFARFPHLADRLAALTVGGLPLFSPDGHFNPELDRNRPATDDDLEPRRPRRRRAA
jgi:hypothetical protein